MILMFIGTSYVIGKRTYLQCDLISVISLSDKSLRLIKMSGTITVDSRSVFRSYVCALLIDTVWINDLK